MPTLEQRRERGDMIPLFKLVNGNDKVDKDDLLLTERTHRLREHGKTLKK